MVRNLHAVLLAGALSLASLMAAGPAQASYFANGVKRQRVLTVPGTARQLPATLVVRPGKYRVGTQTYDMSREGYYRLGRLQRIVYRRSLTALMSGLSWSATSSGRDDNNPDPLAQMPGRRVGLTCGPMIVVAQRVLAQQGITSRHVGTLSKELNQTAPPGQEPGLDHVMIEVLVGGRWQLWDLYNHGRPLINGKPTTVMEWTRPGRDRRLVHIARPDDNIIPERLNAFYKRANYLPLVATPQQTWPFYFTDPPSGPDPEQRQRVYDYRSALEYVPRKDFMARFYPGQKLDY